MADVKISQLPVATTPLDGTEVLPIVQSATTKQVSIANVTAGRAMSASSLTLSTPLAVTSGGTGLATVAQGSFLSATALNTLTATTTPTLGLAGTSAGTLGLSGGTSGVVTIATAAAAGTWTFTLPTSGGTNGFILTTNGSGVSSWTNPTALGIDLDIGTTAITNGTTGRPLYNNAGVLGEYSSVPVSFGGTGLTSLTAGYIPFGNGTSAFGSSANLFWNSANNRLGIGIATPSVALDIVGAQYVRGAAAAGSALVFSSDATSGTNGSSIEASYLSGGYGPLIIKTGGGEKARIDASGNVCIGTPSANGAKLAVGDVANTAIGTQAGFFTGAKTAYAGVTGLPQNQLFVYDTGSGANSGGAISLGGDGGNQTWYAVIQALKDNSTAGNYAASMAFYTRDASNPPAEHMRITSAGEVYIAGTADQGAYNLQVNGTGVWGAGAYTNGSDARLKEDISDIASCLDVVKALRPVTFKYKSGYSKDTNIQTGFIAQELQTAMAGQAYLKGIVQAGPQYLNVAYQSIIPVLTKAIQELAAEVAALKEQINV